MTNDLRISSHGASSAGFVMIITVIDHGCYYLIKPLITIIGLKAPGGLDSLHLACKKGEPLVCINTWPFSTFPIATLGSLLWLPDL